MAFYKLKFFLPLAFQTGKLATTAVFIICCNNFRMRLPFALGLHVNKSWQGWS